MVRDHAEAGCGHGAQDAEERFLRVIRRGRLNHRDPVRAQDVLDLAVELLAVQLRQLDRVGVGQIDDDDVPLAIGPGEELVGVDVEDVDLCDLLRHRSDSAFALLVLLRAVDFLVVVRLHGDLSLLTGIGDTFVQLGIIEVGRDACVVEGVLVELAQNRVRTSELDHLGVEIDQGNAFHVRVLQDLAKCETVTAAENEDTLVTCRQTHRRMNEVLVIDLLVDA